MAVAVEGIRALGLQGGGSRCWKWMEERPFPGSRICGRECVVVGAAQGPRVVWLSAGSEDLVKVSGFGVG